MSASEQAPKTGVEQFLDEHLASLRNKILQRAGQLAGDQATMPVEPRFVVRATFELAPGELFPAELPWHRRVLESISGVTLLSALLMVAFGFLGMWVQAKGGAPGAANSYFDTVRLLAGAIVGSAGAAVAAGRPSSTSPNSAMQPSVRKTRRG
jgi:hypothetical protein